MAEQPGAEHPVYEEPVVLAGCSQVAVLFPLPKSHFTEQLKQIKSFQLHFLKFGVFPGGSSLLSIALEQ